VKKRELEKGRKNDSKKGVEDCRIDVRPILYRSGNKGERGVALKKHFILKGNLVLINIRNTGYSIRE
jgi:hypothetical protein